MEPMNKPEGIDPSLNTPSISPEDIYEGGGLTRITVDDLLNNKTAILQLINDHNTKLKEIQKIRESESDLRSELDYQKTSPFFASIAAIFGVVSTICIGIGVNLLTANQSSGIAIIFLGGIGVLTSNVMTIFHSKVRDMFKGKKESGTKE